MFFFKQKTAYEMRISDWSSDVCSSDLGRWRFGAGAGIVRRFSTHRCISGWLGTAAGVGWRCNAAVGHGRAGAVVVVRGRNEKRFLPGLATVTAAQDPAVVADRQHELVVEEFDLGQRRAALRLHLGLMPRDRKSVGEGTSVSGRVGHGGRRII